MIALATDNTGLTGPLLINLNFLAIAESLLTMFLENQSTVDVNRRYGDYENRATDKTIKFMSVGGEVVFESRFRLEIVNLILLISILTLVPNPPIVAQVSCIVIGVLASFIFWRTAVILWRVKLYKSSVYPGVGPFLIICINLIDIALIAFAIYLTYNI